MEGGGGGGGHKAWAHDHRRGLSLRLAKARWPPVFGRQGWAVRPTNRADVPS